MGKDRTKLLTGITDIVLVAGTVGELDSSPIFKPLEVGGFPMIHAGFLEDETVKLKTSPLPPDRAVSGENLAGGNDLEVRAVGMETGFSHLSNIDSFIRGANRAFWYLRKFSPQIGDKVAIKIGNLGTLLEIEQMLASRSKARFSLIGQRYTDEIGDAYHDDPSPGYLLNIDLNTGDTPFGKVKSFVDYVRSIRQENLVFSVLPDLGDFGQSAKLYDCGPSRLGGDLLNTPTWSTPFLRFDGVNEYANFGDVFGLNSVNDWLIEAWVRIQGANGTTQRILGKKSAPTNGWHLTRFSSDKLFFYGNDGATTITPTPIVTVQQNVWKLLSVAIDRDGLATVYVNAGDPATASMASLGSGLLTTDQFRLGADMNTFGNVDLGRMRVYNFGAGGLPANIASVISRHFNAERAIYGV